MSICPLPRRSLDHALGATCESCELQKVALWGLEPDTLGLLGAKEFIAILELGKMAVEDGLLDE
jgi:hypothetical protein